MNASLSKNQPSAEQNGGGDGFSTTAIATSEGVAGLDTLTGSDDPLPAKETDFRQGSTPYKDQQHSWSKTGSKPVTADLWAAESAMMDWGDIDEVEVVEKDEVIRLQQPEQTPSLPAISEKSEVMIFLLV